MKIIKLSAPWCEPCKKYDTLFAAWAVDNSDLDISIWNINEVIIEKSWQVNEIPTTLILDKNDKLVEKKVGPLTREQLDSWVSQQENPINGMKFRMLEGQDEFNHYGLILENGDHYSWEKPRNLMAFVKKHSLVENHDSVPTDGDIKALKKLKGKLNKNK